MNCPKARCEATVWSQITQRPSPPGSPVSEVIVFPPLIPSTALICFFATFCSKYRTILYYLEKQTTTQLLSFLNSLERMHFRFGTWKFFSCFLFVSQDVDGGREAWMHAKSLQSYWTLWDCSPPGSSVYGILQARILEWVSMPSSRGSSQPRDWNRVFCIAGRLVTIWANKEALYLASVEFKSFASTYFNWIYWDLFASRL